ncbi:MAG: hypothetical protein K0R68_1090 [Mycobacterium sp.]|nr:hypothetical protein [Mycobacterium sp.]
MAHSIELLFDDDTDAALRRVWQALTDAGVPSQLRVQSATNRPHVTVVVTDRLDPVVDTELMALRDRLPLRCTVGAPLVFGHGRLVLAHLIVPSLPLLELHRDVHRICLPHTGSGYFDHAQPGHWTPHATLGRRLDGIQLASAFAVAGVTTEIEGSFTALRRWDGDARTEHVLLN